MHIGFRMNENKKLYFFFEMNMTSWSSGKIFMFYFFGGLLMTGIGLYMAFLGVAILDHFLHLWKHIVKIPRIIRWIYLIGMIIYFNYWLFWRLYIRLMKNPFVYLYVGRDINGYLIPQFWFGLLMSLFGFFWPIITFLNYKFREWIDNDAPDFLPHQKKLINRVVRFLILETHNFLPFEWRKK